MESPTDLQKGYVAGLLDGEGHFHLSRYKPPRYSYNTKVAISNTDLEALELVQSWIGGYIITTRVDGCKPVHRLTFTSKRSIMGLLVLISPHLVIKYDHAQIMMEWCLNDHSKDERSEMIEEMKSLNKRGV